MEAFADGFVRLYLPEGGPGWVDVTEDVISGLKYSWGIPGDSPKDRVAGPGMASFALDNSDQNSAGLEGYYAPDHANCRAGFKIGTPVRIGLSHPLFGERVKWEGTIDKPTPPTSSKNHRTLVDCVDWMDEANKSKPAGLPVLVDTQADEVFETLLSTVTRQPPAVLVTAGSDLYPFALDNFQDEKSTLMSEFQKLAMSEYGYIYVSAGTLVFEGRSVRASGGSVAFSFNSETDLVGMAIAHDREDVINRVQVSVHPRRRDSAATTVLFRMGSAQRIERNTSIQFNAPYRDPSQQAQRVGGINIVDPPVATTDYTFNALETGLGTDLTAQLLVVIDPGGNSANVTVTNNGPFDGYIPAGGLQLRGRGLYDMEPILADESDAASDDDFGQNALAYDMPYQSTPSVAYDTARFILFLNKDAAGRVKSITFLGNFSEEFLQQVFERDISHKISVVVPAAGISSTSYINRIAIDHATHDLIRCTFDLSPASTAQFWTLEVAGRTELNETTVLGYGLFVQRWILDTHTLGVGTFLN